MVLDTCIRIRLAPEYGSSAYWPVVQVEDTQGKFSLNVKQFRRCQLPGWESF